MKKAEPFGYADAPPIEIYPEIKIPEIKIPPTVVKMDAPVIKVEPIIRVEPAKVEVMQPPGSNGWKFTIHKRRDGDIEMTAKPL